MIFLTDVEVVANLWTIGPATVFGSLCAVLAAGNVMQWRKLAEKDTTILQMSNDQMAQLKENIPVLNSLKSSMDALIKATDSHAGQSLHIKDEVLKNRQTVVDEIRNASEKITEQVGRNMHRQNKDL